MPNIVDPEQMASQKPTDLDLYCLKRQGISRFSRIRIKQNEHSKKKKNNKKTIMSYLYNMQETLHVYQNGLYELLYGTLKTKKKNLTTSLALDKVSIPINIWAKMCENIPSDVRWGLNSACTSMQSDQTLPCSHEETLHHWLYKNCPVKILIRLHECAGWSESFWAQVKTLDVHFQKKGCLVSFYYNHVL